MKWLALLLFALFLGTVGEVYAGCPDQISVQFGGKLTLTWSNPGNAQNPPNIIFDGNTYSGSQTLNKWVTNIDTFSKNWVENGCHNLIIGGDTCDYYNGNLIQQPLQASICSKNNVNCAGTCDGEATLCVSGGNPPYSYSWSNGDTDSIAENLCGGTYTVTVTDQTGAPCFTEVLNVTINEPDTLEANITDSSMVSCNGDCDGSATVTATGGVTPYDYFWSNFQTTRQAVNLCAGMYYVTVTDDNGCQEVDSIRITQPAPLNIQSVIKRDVKCPGECTGYIEVDSVSGGTPPYSIVWIDNVGDTVSTLDSATNLCAGDYTAIVTDANGCTDNQSVTINEPNDITANIKRLGESCPGCCDGKAFPTNLTGGTPPYNYTWYDSAGNVVSNQDTVFNICDSLDYTLVVTDSNGCTDTFLTSLSADVIIQYYCDGTCPTAIADISGGFPPYNIEWIDDILGGVISTDDTVDCINNGAYTLKVTDSNGDEFVYSFGVNNKYPMTAFISDTIHESCPGECDGEATVSTNGGYAPFSYQWSDSNSQTTKTAVNLCPGTYTVTVTEDNGCKDTVSVTIEPADTLKVLGTTGQDIKCYGDCTGWVRVDSYAVANPPFTFTWVNSNGDTVGTGDSLSSLCSGTYTVILEDDNGCTDRSSLSLTQPDSLEYSIGMNCASCHGADDAMAKVTSISGGTPPYNYTWIHTITGDTVSQTDSAGGIYDSRYKLVITDSNNCVYEDIITVCGPTLNYDCPDTIYCQPSSDKFRIEWAPSSARPLCLSSIWIDSVNYTVNQFGVGQYQTVSSVPFCPDLPDTLNIIIGNTSIPDQVDCNFYCGALSMSIALDSLKDVKCYGDSTGSIGISINGGAAPYVYTWSNGSSSQDISGLPVDTYSVTVTDSGSCNFATRTFVISQPPPLSLTVDSTLDIACNGDSTGYIGISVSGGVTPYTYQWSNGDTTQDLSNATAGTHTVTVTDSNQCTIDTTVTLTEPPPIDIVVDSLRHVKCHGDSSGYIYVSVSGGVSPYSYNWSNGDTTQDITGLPDGNYTLTVTDSNGCTQDTSKIIIEPTELVVWKDSVVDVACFGDSTGGVFVSDSGGVPPYTYSWSSGQTTQDITNIPAGSYTLTVSDSNNCPDTVQATVTQPPELDVWIDSTRTVDCNGDSTGAIFVSDSGGVPPYTYSWNSGQTTQDITNIPAGTYTLTIIDSNSCTDTVRATIIEPTPLDVWVDSTQNIACFGDSTGAVFVSDSGGVPPYTYQWSNGATTQDVTGLAAGTYTLTITDSNSCTDTVQATITEPTPLDVWIDSTRNIACFGDSTGAIFVSDSGGVPPYTYSWSSGQTTQDITNIPAGTYTLTIIDSNSCTDTVQTTITEPTPLDVWVDSTRTVDCNGDSTGAIFVSDSGGVPPYTYSWSSGQTTQDITNIPAGTYTLTIIDSNSCTDTVQATITEPTPLDVWIDSSRNVLCNGDSTGAIFVSDSGGVPPYTYSWSSGQTTQDITGIPAGSYTLTITDSNSCMDTVQATITEPTPLDVWVDSSRNVLCNGDSTGAIFVSDSGGVPPYTYSWSSGQTTQDITNIPAGTYTLTIIDSNSCTDTVQATITEPTPLDVWIDSSRNVLCNGDSTGAIFVSDSGGVPPYTYSWSSGQTTQDITGIPAGTYTLTVTDSNNCADTLTHTITQPPALSITLDSANNVLCNGDSTGDIYISVSGGITPYSYLWNDGGSSTTQDLTNVPAGTYTVTVTDSNNCTDTFTHTITEPPALVASVDSIHNVLCNGDSTGDIFISVNGGTPHPFCFPTCYDYVWSNGDSSQDLTNVPAGTYTVTVIDDNGCTDTLIRTITEPPALSVAVDSIDTIFCNGDSTGGIYVTGSGGVTPYTFVWSTGDTVEDITGLPAGTYTVTVIDSNGCTDTAMRTLTEPTPLAISVDSIDSVQCNGDSTGAIYISVSGGTSPYAYLWSNGSTNQDLTGVPAGSYTVTVTDDNGCTDTLTRSVNQPNLLTLSIDSTNDVLCNGDSTGAIYVSTTGGVTPYNYTWSSGQTTQDITGLPAGTYTLTVTDDNNCTDTISYTVTEPPALATVVDSIDSIKCNGDSTGAIYISVSGGTTPYTYLWSDGSTSQDLTGAPAGTYTVTVSDSNNCTDTLTRTLTEPPPISIAVDSVDSVLCNGDSTGAVYISVSGGTSPYTYAWSDGSTNQDLTGVPAGTYTVTVTDDNNCTDTLQRTVNEPPLLVTNLDSANNILCNGDSTGAIFISVSGGTTPYTYSWSNGATSQDITGLPAGTYTVTVTDDNNCTDTMQKILTEPPLLTATVDSVDSVLCNGDSSGAVYITVNGGVTPYTYQWSNGATTQDNIGVPAGTYTVTVTDSNSCIDTISATVGEPPALAPTVDSTINVSCNGDSTGAIFISVSGGTAPYTYSWSNGDTAQDITGLPAGTYTVTIADDNNCTDTMTRTITEPPPISITVDSFNNVLCNGDSTGDIYISVSGGTTPYTYLWSNGATTQDITGIPADTYTVTVIDSNSCIDSLTHTITEPDSLSISVDSIHNLLCNGDSTGDIFISVSGGTKHPFCFPTCYDYLWSNGATSKNLNNVPAGTYTVTVTDDNGCTDTITRTITEPPALIASLDSTDDVLCQGDSTGAAYISVSGGVTPYTYTWSNGDTTQDASGLPAGTYTVTVVDSNNCIDTLQATINEPPPISISVDSFNNILCNGDSTGDIYISVSGGTTPYTYLWNDGGSSTTQDLTDVPAGTYTVTVTDSNSCTDTLTHTITEPPVLSISVDSFDNTLCNGDSSGAIFTSTSGGTSPYSYLWSNNDTTADVTGLPAGTYTVTVTDNNGCTDTTSATINEPTELDVYLDSVRDVKCNGNNTGGVFVSDSGGTPGYNYSWSNSATTQDISGVPAGTYTLTITDDNGCTDTLSATVNEPPAVLISLDSSNNVLCNGDSTGDIYISVSGGTTPYGYSWSNGATTQDITGIPAGTYTVTVSDSNNCTETFTHTITEPPALSTTLDSSDNILCNGDSTGAIFISVSGGTTPYGYTWSNGASTQDITGIPAGTYTVTVSDSNSCIDTFTHTITEPPTLAITIDSVHHPDCWGDSTGYIGISVSGGAGGYVYSWSNGATTQDINGLPDGTYSVTVTDANGCTIDTAEDIVQPPKLSDIIVDSITHVDCNGANTGAAYISVSGGATPYTYLWSTGATTQDITGVPAGTYGITVTDSNGCTLDTNLTINEPPPLNITVDSTNDVQCNGYTNGKVSITTDGGIPPYNYNWSNGDTTEDIDSLTAGTYTVTVTDSNNCATTVSVTISEPPPYNVNLTPDTAICLGDSITLNASPGQNFNWQPSSGLSCTNCQSPNASPITNTTYTVIAQNANMCPDTETVTIDVNPLPTAYFVADTVCAGLPTTFDDRSVGNGIQSWFWDFGDGSSTQVQEPKYTYEDGGTRNVSLTVVDSNGCEQTFNRNVKVVPIPFADFDHSPQQTTILNPTVNFTDQSSDNSSSWFWDFGTGDSSIVQNPTYTYGDTGTYTVTLITENDFGCKDTTQKPVLIEKRFSLYIPNVFTPNGDDVTDEFNVVGLLYTIEDYNMQIWNRWGELIYQSDDPTQGWNGRKHGTGDILQDGVYIYVINVTDFRGVEHKYEGYVYLMK